MIRNFTLGVLGLVCVWLAPVSVSAQTNELRPFCADRPGKGAASCVLDQGHFQVEVGAFDGAHQQGAATEVDSWSAGSITARFGVAPATEFQVGITAFERETVTDRVTGVEDVAEGTGDLFLAVRQGLIRPDGEGFSVALMGYATLPTGGDEVRASGIEAGVVVPVSIDLGNEWGLGLSPYLDIVRDEDGEGSHAAYSFAVDVDRDLGDWILGAEVWVSRDDDPLVETTQASADLIAIWTPAFLPDSQIDFSLNFGLNDDSPDVEFGVGVARRF